MKNLILIVMIGLMSTITFAQDESTVYDKDKDYRIELTDGQEIIGKILEYDEREFFIQAEDGRKFYVPAYKVKEVTAIKDEEYNMNGNYVGEDQFATRYFLTTNGLPVKKGEHYVQWNIYGPDFQFGVGDNFGIGVMTTWIGSPVLINAKYSFQLGEKTQFAIGAVGGTGTWLAPDWGGVLPFGTLSFGTRRANIAFSGGYGAVWSGNSKPDGRPLASMGAMIKLGPRASFVFDSFFLLPNTTTREGYMYNEMTGQYTYQEYQTQTELLGFFTPGVRIHLKNQNAFQFGATGLILDDWVVPAPIPTLQYYHAF